MKSSLIKTFLLCVFIEDTDSKTALLASILEREIIKEISVRRGDLETIEQRIYQTRQSLAKIRQGVVSEYYKQNYKVSYFFFFWFSIKYIFNFITLF